MLVPRIAILGAAAVTVSCAAQPSTQGGQYLQFTHPIHEVVVHQTNMVDSARCRTFLAGAQRSSTWPAACSTKSASPTLPYRLILKSLTSATLLEVETATPELCAADEQSQGFEVIAPCTRKVGVVSPLESGALVKGDKIEKPQ